MWKTLGHLSQKKFLEKVLQTKKYAHAYLFCGPSQIGKKTLALEFAAKIVNANQDNFNPDIKILSQDKVKIEEVRKLISELALHPYNGEHKVVIIDNFETVTDEAANALLKTFEEPNATSIIILIASNYKAVLPTILSRAQVIYFNRLEKASILEVINDKSILWMFDGKIGKAIKYATDPEFKKRLVQECRQIVAIKAQDISGRLLAIKEYAALETSELSETFENWLDAEHCMVTRDTPEKYGNLSLLIESISGIRQNFNKKLILEKLFLNIA